MIFHFIGIWPFWYHFVAVLVCGRFRLWPFWYVAVLDVHPSTGSIGLPAFETREGKGKDGEKTKGGRERTGGSPIFEKVFAPMLMVVCNEMQNADVISHMHDQPHRMQRH